MARPPKPTAKASLSIYSTRQEDMSKATATSEPLADLSLSRISSSQTTTHGSPSDETNDRRGSTSSSLSSSQTADNTSFITLKYSPPVNRAISLLDPTFTSTESSPTKAKSRESPEESTNGSRTRSSRNRKLTGKAFDLAVSGKLYKSEKLARNSSRTSENSRKDGRNDEDDRSILSFDTDNEHTSPSPSSRRLDVGIDAKSAEGDQIPKQIEHGQQDKALGNSVLGVEALQVTSSTDSLYQDVKSAAKDAQETDLPRKRRRLQSPPDSVISASNDRTALIVDVQPETDMSSKDQESALKIKSRFPKREPRKAARGKDSMAGQASLRSTRQRMKGSLADQVQHTDEETVIPDRVDGASSNRTADSQRTDPPMTDSQEHQSCQLDCLDEADVLIAFTEYILNTEEGGFENGSPEVQYTQDLRKEVSTIESLAGLKEYCKCDGAGKLLGRNLTPRINHDTAESS